MGIFFKNGSVRILYSLGLGWWLAEFLPAPEMELGIEADFPGDKEQ